MKTENELFEYVSETERLVLRPLKKADYENWLNEFNRRYPSQHRHDTGRTDMSDCTEEWFNKLIDKHQNLALTDTAYIFGVFRQEDGTHVGMVDLSTIERGEFQWGRIGYSFHNRYWGKGYGREAVNEVLHMAFKCLSFHRIEAHINIDNPASIKLAENVGMEYECIRKGFIFEFGEWTDNLIYFKNLVE
ncbi:GNAT family N-acetyltransferase [Alkalibacillus salilacus]|uniref:RimJ/RimL family protein N-acetyltransferase n=1 Tax=Alkalibacillus salilacus TaxID=284582 RepID=A0ABT9VIJ0_9BACI|nr:GNAT family protein [Alkalibacillus salilacus]MDQ0160773.1 RimJ/RimL family protein N-acetyltransferase [Alkalibacillus salilacus]